MADEALFAPWFAGRSWDPWRAILKAAFGLPMLTEEVEIFRALAGGREPPRRRVRELWVVGGRRAGKDSVASVIASYVAALCDQRDRLRVGERAVAMILACDRAQARQCLGYIRGYFEAVPLLRGIVTRWGADGLELANSSEIAVHTNSFRLVRGRSLSCVIMSEVSFWRDENSANPDHEIYNAVLPGLMTLPGAMLIGISSGYRKSGLLYSKYRDHYGRDSDEILVIAAPSIALNPTLDQRLIDQAIEADPAAASVEWGISPFRSDLESFVAREVVEAAVVPGRFELPPVSGTQYLAGCDPSGGSQDAMTLAICHASADQPGVAVVDCVREVKPPFSPEAVVEEFSATLKSYGLSVVTGDRYAGEWPREQFAKRGIGYQPSARPKSDVYRDSLPLLNSGRIELLDNKRLVNQIASLERRTGRGGRDSIDHPVGAHDDLANSVFIAALLAANQSPVMAFPNLDFDIGSPRDPLLFTPRPFSGDGLSSPNLLRGEYWSPRSGDW